MTGDSTLPTATVKLDLDGEVKYRAETGVGPVDEALNAILKIQAGRQRSVRLPHQEGKEGSAWVRRRNTPRRS